MTYLDPQDWSSKKILAATCMFAKGKVPVPHMFISCIVQHLPHSQIAGIITANGPVVGRDPP